MNRELRKITMINRVYYYMENGNKKRIVPESAKWEMYKRTYTIVFSDYIDGVCSMNSPDDVLHTILSIEEKGKHWYWRLWWIIKGWVEE